jgi:hypothetical protein
MSKIYVFGYGSLIAASGVNGRNMHRRYVPSDITECSLTGYFRALNAVFRAYDDERDLDLSLRFFGISPSPTAGQSVNGIIFPLDRRDIDPFIRSEGGDHVYDFRDVTKGLVFDHAQESPLKAGDKVYACIPKRPSKDGYVSRVYVDRCNRALIQRSDLFRARFGTVEGYLP